MGGEGSSYFFLFIGPAGEAAVWVAHHGCLAPGEGTDGGRGGHHRAQQYCWDMFDLFGFDRHFFGGDTNEVFYPYMVGAY